MPYQIRNLTTSGMVLWWNRLPGGGYTSWSDTYEEAAAAALDLAEQGGGEYEIVKRP
jgi:hypothetical protein